MSSTKSVYAPTVWISEMIIDMPLAQVSMLKKESLKSHANRKIHKKIYSRNLKHKCLYFFFCYTCDKFQNRYKMKSRFGTKTVALTTPVPRLAESRRGDRQYFYYYFYQRKSFSSHKRRSNKNAYKHNRRHTYALTHTFDHTRSHLNRPKVAPKTRKQGSNEVTLQFARLFLAFSARPWVSWKEFLLRYLSQLKVRELTAGQNNDYQSKQPKQINTSKLLLAVSFYLLSLLILSSVTIWREHRHPNLFYKNVSFWDLNNVMVTRRGRIDELQYTTNRQNQVLRYMLNYFLHISYFVRACRLTMYFDVSRLLAARYLSFYYSILLGKLSHSSIFWKQVRNMLLFTMFKKKVPNL